MTHLAFSDIETPGVVLDYSRLLDNIHWMQNKADSNHVRLRPHIKTHKCVTIAKLQLGAGAVGITASKTDEALTFIEAGTASVTVAYPILDQRKLDRLLSAASLRGVDLRLVVDSETGVDAIASAAARNAVSVQVLLEIDVGLHRCGLREEDPNLLSLVHRINDSPQLEFIGLLSHAGHAYAAKSPAEVRAVAEDERLILQRVRQSIERSGVGVREVSVGATPTAIVSESYSGITEIRPGNYVFLDLTSVRLGLIGAERLALSIVATVVSMNQDYFIVDAGSKVLSSDLGAHGTGERQAMAWPIRLTIMPQRTVLCPS